MRLTKDTVVSQLRPNAVRAKKAGERIETTVGRITFNRSLPADYPFINHEVDKKGISRIVEDCSVRYSTTQMAQILDEVKRLGFHYATRAGVTVSVYDAIIPKEKPAILAASDEKVAKIEDQYDIGLITREERHRQIVDVWTRATDEVGDAMGESFDKFNPIYMMAYSGARGNIKQIRQLAGMRGLMANPKGEIIDRPIKANFREGLTVLEYFISTHGARKGLADTALRTADSGYLTRRLVDVAQDVIVRENDCGTDEGVAFKTVKADGQVDHNLGRPLPARAGRQRRERARSSWRRARTSSPDAELQELADGGRRERRRTHGHDLPRQARHLPGLLRLGPRQQPPRRHRHGGRHHRRAVDRRAGHAAHDAYVPHRWRRGRGHHPRPAACHRALRGPQAQGPGDPCRGGRKTDHRGPGEDPQVSPSDDERAREGLHGLAPRHPASRASSTVRRSSSASSSPKGSVNPHDLLHLKGPNETLRYIVEQVQDVYRSQGVDINDKHIEVISRQMLRKVSVTEPGDTDFLPGQLADRLDFAAANNDAFADSGEPANGHPTLLGITKASLATDSYLSAASFQETTRVLTDAAIAGKEDNLLGLKENVIIGKLIPAATGMKRYRNVKLTYKGQHIEAETTIEGPLPDWAPEELKEIEALLPVAPGDRCAVRGGLRKRFRRPRPRGRRHRRVGLHRHDVRSERRACRTLARREDRGGRDVGGRGASSLTLTDIGVSTAGSTSSQRPASRLSPT